MTAVDPAVQELAHAGNFRDPQRRPAVQVNP